MEHQNPELHINEEPRNDFVDVAVGFLATFTFFTVVTIIAMIVSAYV
jgi:uncharacterized protein (DUF2062 family)